MKVVYTENGLQIAEVESWTWPGRGGHLELEVAFEVVEIAQHDYPPWMEIKVERVEQPPRPPTTSKLALEESERHRENLLADLSAAIRERDEARKARDTRQQMNLEVNAARDRALKDGDGARASLAAARSRLVAVTAQRDNALRIRNVMIAERDSARRAVDDLKARLKESYDGDQWVPRVAVERAERDRDAALKLNADLVTARELCVKDRAEAWRQARRLSDELNDCRKGGADDWRIRFSDLLTAVQQAVLKAER